MIVITKFAESELITEHINHWILTSLHYQRIPPCLGSVLQGIFYIHPLLYNCSYVSRKKSNEIGRETNLLGVRKIHLQMLVTPSDARVLVRR